jgi:hypothetical protein
MGPFRAADAAVRATASATAISRSRRASAAASAAAASISAVKPLDGNASLRTALVAGADIEPLTSAAGYFEDLGETRGCLLAATSQSTSGEGAAVLLLLLMLLRMFLLFLASSAAAGDKFAEVDETNESSIDAMDMARLNAALLEHNRTIKRNTPC